jgi:hypothetical protein
VDQVFEYLRLGSYYGLFAAYWVCVVILLGYLVWNKQWLVALLTVAFTAAFYPAGPLIILGPVLAIVIGWQEAAKWKAKNLLRVTSALMVVCFLLLSRTYWVEFMKPAPKVDQAKLARERAAKAQKSAASKAK